MTDLVPVRDEPIHVVGELETGLMIETLKSNLRRAAYEMGRSIAEGMASGMDNSIEAEYRVIETTREIEGHR